MGNSLMSRLEQESIPSKDDNRLNVMEFQGLMIYIGKNALTNEKIVQEHPHRECLWLHAVGAKGSHVILCCGGKRLEFTDEAIQHAGAMALRYSRSNARSVWLTRLENVVKPKNSSPGVFFPSKQVLIEIL